MVCALCDSLLTGEKRTLFTNGTKYLMHKTCLRKATHEDLIRKGIVSPSDKAWWTKF